eukprot:955018-Prymnesium_polylepis.1
MWSTGAERCTAAGRPRQRVRARRADGGEHQDVRGGARVPHVTPHMALKPRRRQSASCEPHVRDGRRLIPHVRDGHPP